MKHNPVVPATKINNETGEMHGFPYPVSYSSHFEIGKIDHSKILLDLWKDFDDNTLDEGAHVFADHVRMDACDGTTVEGSRAQFIAAMKSQRQTFTSFTSTINAIVSLKPKEKEESWACVWGEQTSVTTDNKTSSVLINENWMFDKDGKISYIRQFDAVPQSS